MTEHVMWKTAPPLWREALAGKVELDCPMLLRFDSDDFVERLQRTLDDPQAPDVGAFALRSETWKQPLAGLSATPDPETPRLYQPIQGRHYLVAGGLVCQRYGLPDKALHPNFDESVFFVLRRLQPTGTAAPNPADPASYHEFGWVASGPSGRWVAVDTALAAGEQRLAVFPMTYRDATGVGPPPGERRRRLLAGTIPVASREQYEGALPPNPLGNPSDPVDAALAVLAQPGRDRLFSVASGFESLLRSHAARPTAAGAKQTAFDALFLEAWFFALVDLGELLEAELPGVLSGTPTAAEQTLAGQFQAARFRADDNPTNWLAGVRQALANRTSTAAPPVPVAGMNAGPVGSANSVLAAFAGLGLSTSDPVAARTRLFAKINAALPAPAPPPPPPPAGEPQPARDPKSVYVTRLVYERPRCPESHRWTVSAPSAAFHLAHFYDPDAPFRDNRIVLPVDTSLEGLRKFPKAVKMELSAQLRKQVERVQAIKLSDLEDGNIPPEGGGNLGMICSLSIPIITISALILLMIIVSVLNIIFFWVPLFRICLPKASD